MERKDDIEFKRSIEYKDVHTDSACDVSLPDYKGEVKRVLSSSATVLPSGKYSDGNELCFSGIVSYSVVYLNSENCIEDAEFTSDYEFSLRHPEQALADFWADTAVASVAIRLTGPRRFSAKSSLSSVVTVIEDSSLSVEYGISGCTPELDTRTVNVMSKHRFPPAEKELAHKLADFDGAVADDIRIIAPIAQLSVSSITRSSSEACVKGNVTVDYIVENGSLPPYRERAVVPLEQSISVDAISEDACLCAHGRVSSVRVSVNAEDFGANAVVNMIVEIELEVKENNPITVATDGYMRECGSCEEYEDMAYTELIADVTLNEHHEVAVEASEIGLAELRDVLSCSATAKVDGIEFVGDGASVKGEIRYSGIVSTVEDNGCIGYSGFKYSAPFAYKVNFDCQNVTKNVVNPQIELYGCGAQIDKNELVLSCDVRLCADLREAKCIRRLRSLVACPQDAYERRDSLLTVYYPDGSESLFDVAKRFHTTVKDIAVSNSISESVMSLQGTGAPIKLKRLIIK